MAESRPNPQDAPGWVSRNLVTLGAAAVLAVYAAGYERTRAAAERFEGGSSRRHADTSSAAAAGSGAVAGEDARGALRSRAATGGTDDSVRSAGTGAEPLAPPAPLPLPTAAGTFVRGTAREKNPVPTGSAEAKAAPKKSEAGIDSAAAPATAVQAAAVPGPTTTPLPPVATEGVAPKPATPATDTAAAASPWKDGTYAAWGYSRHGDLEATVEIQGGRIVAAQITQCWTRYPCSRIEHLVPQVVERQSEEVDNVSGATQSADALYWAVKQALKKARS